MINNEKLFGNPFDEPSIPTTLLIEFTKDMIERLTTANTNHQYDDMIAQAQTDLDVLEADVEKKDVSVTVRLGKTQTVDEVTAEFGQTMSDLYGVIAHSLGGSKKPEMLEFYPDGLTEYNKINRDNMAVITNRIFTAAGNHSAALGTDITAQLQAFKASFLAARKVQVSAKSDVTSSKPVISAERTKLELTNTMIVRKIASLYPGDVATCSSLFDFSLLYNPTHHKHDVHTGDVPAGGSVTVANITFTDTMKLKIKDTSENADFRVWIGMIPFDPDNGKAVLVKSGKGCNLKPSQISNGNGTFLTIKNDSSVNIASYSIDIIG